jgi:3-oxoacyl-[acyl-carrier-protein] synthase II
MRRVVVTGMGMLTPLGCGVEPAWQRLLKGESGARPIDRFDVSDMACKIACTVPRGDGSNETFNPDQWMEPKEQRKVDDFIVYAMCAAKQALDDAGWRPESYEDQTASGVLIGSGIGGIEGIADMAVILHEKGPRRVSPFFIPGRIINLASGFVSIAFGLKGPCHAVVTACSTGAHAIGDAARMVALGDAEVMVAGGAESPVNRMALAGFAALRALSTHFNDDPKRASRPYDKDRDGFVMGEGASVLVLEERSRAIARGAKIYGEVVGFGMSNDAYHMTAPRPDGSQAARSMRRALDDAGVSAGEVGYVNAHGSSTPLNDSTETVAIKQVFGERAYSIPVSGTKGYYGHALGASGAIEAAICGLAMSRDWLPPTVNLANADEACDLDYIKRVGRASCPEVVLSNSFGFGGINAALVFRREG